MIPAYPKILRLEKVPSFKGQPVFIQEKIDGSQFSFKVYGDRNGKLSVEFRSKNQALKPPYNKQFAKACEWVLGNIDALPTGYIFRTEAVTSPRHNCIKYDDPPECGFIVWDIEHDIFSHVSSYPLSPRHIAQVCTRYNLPFVPSYYLESFAIENLMIEDKNKSILGGPMEGFVIRNQSHVPIAKYVFPEFQEVASPKKKQGKLDVKSIVDRFATPARYQKGIQTLKDHDNYSGSVKDISALINTVFNDIKREEQPTLQELGYRLILNELKRKVSSDIVEMITAQSNGI